MHIKSQEQTALNHRKTDKHHYYNYKYITY